MVPSEVSRTDRLAAKLAERESAQSLNHLASIRTTNALFIRLYVLYLCHDVSVTTIKYHFFGYVGWYAKDRQRTQRPRS